MADLDVIGVQAVFEGFQEYLQKINAYNTATASTATSTQKATAATETHRKSVGQLGKDERELAGAFGILDNSLARTLRNAIAAGVGFAGLFAGVKGFQNTIATVQDLGQAVFDLQERTGLTAEKASDLLFVFDHVGLGAAAANSILTIFERNLKGVQDAADGVPIGGKAAVAVLKDLGITAIDASGKLKPMDAILSQLADKFKTLPDGAEKTGIAVQLFGRGGAEILPVLNQGSAGIAALSAQAKALGLELSGPDVKAIQDYKYAQRDLGQAVDGLKVQLGSELLPLLTTVTLAFVHAQPAVRGFIQSIEDNSQGSRDFGSQIVRGLGGAEAVFKSLTSAAVLLGATLLAIKAGEFTSSFIGGIQSELSQFRSVQATLSREAAFIEPQRFSTPFGAAGQSQAGQTPGLLGAIVSQVNPVTAALVAGTVAFAGLDLAARHFTGGGIISFLDGETAAHDRAADAAKRQGTNLDTLNRLKALGVEGDNANSLRLLEIDKSIAQSQATFDAAKARADAAVNPALSSQDRQSAIGNTPRSRGDTSGQLQSRILGDAPDVFNTDLDTAAKSIIGLQLPYAQLHDYATSHPIFGTRFDAELASDRAALVLVQGELATTADAFRSARAAFDKGLKLADSSLTRETPEEAGLKVQIDLLEQVKRHLQDVGDTEGIKAVDAQLASMNNRLAETSAVGKIAADSLDALALVTAENAGGTDEAFAAAQKQVKAFGDQLDLIPASQRVKIEAQLPFDDIVKMQQLLDLVVNQKYTIDVALNILSQPLQGPTPSGGNLSDQGALQGPTQFGGTLDDPFGYAAQLAKIKQGALDAAPAFEKQGAATSGAGSAAAGAAKEVDHLTQVLQAVQSGTISLADAMRLGLSDEQVITLELEVARQKEADAAFRSRIEFEKLAQVLGEAGITAEAFNLAIALKAIADELKRTGESVAQFLARIAADALSKISSQLATAESQQTVEDVTLQLRLDELKLEKAKADNAANDPAAAGNAKTIAEAHLAQQRLTGLEDEAARAKKEGATDKELAQLDAEIKKTRALAQEPDLAAKTKTASQKLDDEIAAIEKQIAIRAAENAVMKDKIALDSGTLVTDANRLEQIKLLTIAEKDAAAKANDLAGKAFLAEIAAGRLATALGGAADAATAWILAWQAFNPDLVANGQLAPTDKSPGVQFDPNVKKSGYTREEWLFILRSTGQYTEDVIQARLKQLFGYERGTDYVPQNQWAYLHQGEKVVPASANQMQSAYRQQPAPVFQIPFAPNLQMTEGLSREEAQTLMHGMVDEIFYNSRGLASRAGSVLTSTIGGRR